MLNKARAKAGMKKILDGLYLINLDQPIKGFKDFISAWLLQKNGMNILVDPGPSSTILHLCSALKKHGVQRIDLILLTHIHLDHAGGSGLLLKKFPETRVICHPKAIKHLINPEKLWKGSLTVLGKLAEIYSPVTPVPASNLTFQSRVIKDGLTIEAIETPGHAAHHLVFKINDLLFLGEVAGVNIPLPQGNFLRIATPPVFKYEIYKDSLQKAARLTVKHLCFGHYGYRNDPQYVFNQALKQLDLWVETIQQNVKAGIVQEEPILDRLMETDPALAYFCQLPFDIQERERYFCTNSIRGILEYLTSSN